MPSSGGSISEIPRKFCAPRNPLNFSGSSLLTPTSCLESISAKEEEAKSAAYIQKLLAKEQRYMQEYGNYDYDLEEEREILSEDDDYIPSGAKKRTQRKSKLSRTLSNGSTAKRKQVDTDIVRDPNDVSPSVLTDNPNPDLESKWKRGPWSELEEQRFLDALELFGREWRKVDRTNAGHESDHFQTNFCS
jgi:hypothetical protein